MEKEIIALLQQKGPSTGSEILEVIGGDELLLWQTCKRSEKLDIRTVGTHYMRLDRNVEGYARMSPSILREFLTYTVVGVRGDEDRSGRRAENLVSHMEKVSRAKLELAYRTACSLATWVESEWAVYDMICFIIAGDIVYNMAHDVPRPERSTKKMVKGSDMDVVVIVDDHFPDNLKKKLDDAIYQEKYRLLMTPHLREELDYIVKDLNRVREQVHFDTFKHMVACKILYEGTLLYGSERLFTEVKSVLRESGVTDRIVELERQAEIFRQQAEAFLLTEDFTKANGGESLSFFYPTEESEEFE